MGQAKLTFAGEMVPEYYVASFDSVGGNSIRSQIVPPGMTITKPFSPVKSGEVFRQWTYNGDDFDFSTPIYHDITLVADYL